jgi:hypothetical protein
MKIPDELAQSLGVRRTMTLRRLIRQTALPPEALLDLALELLELAARKMAPPRDQRQTVGLAAARWHNVSPEQRSEQLRRAALARWRKKR